MATGFKRLSSLINTGNLGEIYTSPDAVTWTKQESIETEADISYFASFGNDFPLVAVCFEIKIFVAEGAHRRQFSTSNLGTLELSIDEVLHLH